MMRGFIVVGCENSGTKMLAEALCRSGCFGDYGHEQRLDTLDFSADSRVTIPAKSGFSSQPCGMLRRITTGWPGCLPRASRLSDCGFAPTVLAIHRKLDYLERGQIERGYAKSSEVVRTRYLAFFARAISLDAEVHLVPYEAFTESPRYRDALLARLGLPATDMPIANMNRRPIYQDCTALPI